MPVYDYFLVKKKGRGKMNANQLSQMILLCRKKDKNGQIRFLVYDPQSNTGEELEEHQLIELIMAHKIRNARVENAVIKTTDGNCGVKTVSDEGVKIYYYLTAYTSKIGTKIFVFVDNNFSVYEMSEEVMIDFFNQREILNAKIVDKKLIINRGTSHKTALNRPLHHIL